MRIVCIHRQEGHLSTEADDSVQNLTMRHINDMNLRLAQLHFPYPMHKSNAEQQVLTDGVLGDQV